MNQRIRELAEQAKLRPALLLKHWGTIDALTDSEQEELSQLEQFAELIKQAIYDDVKEELMDDSIINEEPDSVIREYLKGCNGGIVDALFHIKNFGKDLEQ